MTRKIIGCKGSEPRYRGYPCGLWQLFHTITVNAAKDDDSNEFTGLSSTIFDYVQHFFQCRHCAKNFVLKVQSINQGALPVKPKEIMMWLWRIHNKANVKLSGTSHCYSDSKLKNFDYFFISLKFPKFVNMIKF